MNDNAAQHLRTRAYRLSRSGRYDMSRLKEAMLLLIANDAPLGGFFSVRQATSTG